MNNTRICRKCGSEIGSIYIECPACNEDEANKRFKAKRIKPEHEQKLLFTIRLNTEERAVLDDIKIIFDVPSDSTALKIGCFQGFHLLQNTFPVDFLKWIASKDRARLYDQRVKK